MLLKTWQRTNNVGNCWTISPWGNGPGFWNANTRARVAEEVNAIKHWKFLLDGLKVMRRRTTATWFVDPPYQFNYQYRQQSLDYRELASQVLSLQGQILVCEATEVKTGRIPDWLPFRVFGDCITNRRKANQNNYSQELIWTKEVRQWEKLIL